jgi:glycosyltransferase involved in cell wall biosynthesis
MMMRRLLLVAYTFPPAAQSGALRASRLARGLGAHGWRVTVLTADAAHAIVRDEALLARLPPDVEVVRVADPLPPRTLPLAGIDGRTAPPGRLARLPRPVAGLLRRAKRAVFTPDEQVLWARRARAAARGLHAAHPFDAVLVTSPYHSAQVVGEDLARRGVPYVADLRDPWTLNPLYAERFPWTRAAERRTERRCLAAARAIVFTNDVVRDRYAALHPDLAGRMRVVTNAYDEDEFDDAARPLARTFLLVHAGNLYAARDPRPFLRGLAAFLGRRPEARGVTRAEFLGVTEHDLLDAARAEGVGDVVRFTGFVAHADAVRRLGEAAVLVLITGLDDRTDLFVPGKVFEYLGAGRSILALVPPASATGRLLAGKPAARLVGVDDPAAAAAALGEVFDRWRRDPASVALPPDPACRAAAMVGAFADLLSAIS